MKVKGCIGAAGFRPLGPLVALLNLLEPQLKFRRLHRLRQRQLLPWYGRQMVLPPQMTIPRAQSWRTVVLTRLSHLQSGLVHLRQSVENSE